MGASHIGIDLLREILAPSRALLEASFAAMRDDHGSIDRYLSDALGLTERGIAALQGRLLE